MSAVVGFCAAQFGSCDGTIKAKSECDSQVLVVEGEVVEGTREYVGRAGC